MSAEYKKLHERLLVARKTPEAKAERAKISQEIRETERESARNGVVLNAVYHGDRVTVESQSAPTKRSLHEEYCRKFNDKAKAEMGDGPFSKAGEPISLRTYHERRLLNKK